MLAITALGMSSSIETNLNSFNFVMTGWQIEIALSVNSGCGLSVFSKKVLLPSLTSKKRKKPVLLHQTCNHFSQNTSKL